MGKMHAPGKGISRSSLPYRRAPPSWCKVEAQAVIDDICKHSKKGLTPSQIGVILRDSQGIPQVSAITGSKILRILKAQGVCSRALVGVYRAACAVLFSYRIGVVWLFVLLSTLLYVVCSCGCVLPVSFR